MKKVLSIIILITLILSLSSCGKKDTAEETEKPEEDVIEESVEEPDEAEAVEEISQEEAFPSELAGSYSLVTGGFGGVFSWMEVDSEGNMEFYQANESAGLVETMEASCWGCKLTKGTKKGDGIWVFTTYETKGLTREPKGGEWDAGGVHYVSTDRIEDGANDEWEFTLISSGTSWSDVPEYAITDMAKDNALSGLSYGESAISGNMIYNKEICDASYILSDSASMKASSELNDAIKMEVSSAAASSSDSEVEDTNSAAWADAYLNHIYENVGGYNPEYTYDLEDINGDGTPELIMIAPSGDTNAADQIVTYGNGEISQVWDGHLAVIKGENLVYTVWGRQSSFTERLYTINNGKFEQIDESVGGDFAMRLSLTEEYGEGALQSFDGTYDYQGIIEKINAASGGSSETQVSTSSDSSFSDVFFPDAKLQLFKVFQEPTNGINNMGIEILGNRTASYYINAEVVGAIKFDDGIQKVDDYHYILTVSENTYNGPDEFKEEASKSFPVGEKIHIYAPGAYKDDMPSNFYTGQVVTGEGPEAGIVVFDDYIEIAFDGENRLIRPALVEDSKLSDGHIYLFMGNGGHKTFITGYSSWS